MAMMRYPRFPTEATMAEKVKIGILGASGYTGSELVRLLLRHPRVDLTLLTADSKAGRPMADVFPQFAPFQLPDLVAIPEDWSGVPVDLVFCALPHGTTQQVITRLLAARPEMRVVDLSADFRLGDKQAYASWYGHDHQAPDLQEEAVYGLTEVYRDAVKGARLVANPGCYTTTAQLAVLPLLRAKAIEPDAIIIDAKSGVTGAGRAAKEANLFTEVSEGFHAYGVGHHRHMAELDEQFSILAQAYRGEPFVHVLPFGKTPQTRHVRGSNHTHIGVAADRRSDRAILVAALDNLVKGASGQAVQNMNAMLGFAETTGLDQIALFP
jgi:N-acetyl-gamma-glutamyl-phosphate reductase